MLGGTGEARELAHALVQSGKYELLVSLGGRTDKPAAQPVLVRIGGFGGADGLAAFLREGRFDLLIDATHPFAARISRNAVEAAAAVGIPAFALRRAEWTQKRGDNWQHVASLPEAIDALGPLPRRVFLAIGRQEAHRAEAAPQHFYLVRSVDAVEPPLALPELYSVLDRGPFDVESEAALLSDHLIDAVITKNSGGAATYAKIEAARRLGIEVLMIARAPAPAMQAVAKVEEALAAIDHLFPPAVKRGV